MVDDVAKAEIQKRIYGSSLVHRQIFTSEVVDTIGDEFDIPTHKRDSVGQALETAAFRWTEYNRRSAMDSKAIKKDLKTIGKAADVLASTLKCLSPDTLDVLIEAGAFKALRGIPFPRVCNHGSHATLEYASPSKEGTERVEFASIGLIMEALCHVAEDAQPAFPTGRRGNNGLFDLIHGCFQVWEGILKRSFKLDWASDGEPVTDAAKFCKRVSRLVEPNLSLQQIATAARKVRKESIIINDLKELPKAIEHFDIRIK